MGSEAICAEAGWYRPLRAMAGASTAELVSCHLSRHLTSLTFKSWESTQYPMLLITRFLLFSVLMGFSAGNGSVWWEICVMIHHCIDFPIFAPRDVGQVSTFTLWNQQMLRMSPQAPAASCHPLTSTGLLPQTPAPSSYGQRRKGVQEGMRQKDCSQTLPQDP